MACSGINAVSPNHLLTFPFPLLSLQLLSSPHTTPTALQTVKPPCRCASTSTARCGTLSSLFILSIKVLLLTMPNFLRTLRILPPMDISHIHRRYHRSMLFRVLRNRLRQISHFRLARCPAASAKKPTTPMKLARVPPTTLSLHRLADSEGSMKLVRDAGARK